MSKGFYPFDITWLILFFLNNMHNFRWIEEGVIMLNLVKNSTRSVWQHKSKIFIMMIIALVFLSGMEFNTVVLGEEQQPTYSAYKNSYSQFINEKAEEIVLPADNYKQAT